MKRIATIGYEASSIDEFVGQLQAAGVKRLIDIRELPLSRKKGFSKRALNDVLSDAGIEYAHFRDLGDPKPGRDAARSGQIKKFQKIFNQHMETSAATEALEEVANIASDCHSALLCFEKDHLHCHRAIVADRLRLNYGFQIEHLKVHTAKSDAGSGRGSRGSC